MNPSEFQERMIEICEKHTNKCMKLQCGIALMTALLRDLGYEDGIDTFYDEMNPTPDIKH